MKNFKVAQIVALGQLPDISRNHYHMCLAHLVNENKEYANFYAEMAKRGKYVLMDNGAAEGSQLEPDDLIKLYNIINPTEIVLPDTLNDSVDTLRKTLMFVEMCGDLPFKFMAVPQGKSFQEWCDCASIMMRNPRINSIGISKFLNIATGSKTIRYSAVNYIADLMEEFGRRDIEVHLLGCDEGPEVVKKIQECFPFVRGCDSAFGYIACQSGVNITPTMERPEGEIDFLNTSMHFDYGDYAKKLEDCMGVQSNEFDWSWK